MTDKKSIPQINPEDMPSMTPDQLLARDNYAVVRFYNGEFAWMGSSFMSLEAATAMAATLREDTGEDYRAVSIEHGSEVSS